MSVSGMIILNALEAAASEAVESGWLDESVFEDAPRSHVFMAEPGEPFDEDDVEAIKLVGEQDVAAKIAYWRNVLDGAAK